MRIVFCAIWNYLRARGEYIVLERVNINCTELPPRTRRILRFNADHIWVSGTTSAHAENTQAELATITGLRNYLRARGEYSMGGRTTRIHVGTTSAHAENTQLPKSWMRNPRNYLRARGEYNAAWIVLLPIMELPPRTRRIPLSCGLSHGNCGTTSAHAENTPSAIMSDVVARNYLRARGEYKNANDC